MPAAIVVELLAELFGQLIIGLATEGAEAGTAAAKKTLEERRARRRERALARVDLLVLAAYHDHVITEAERGVLATACSAILSKVDLDADVDELLGRWADTRAALRSEAEFVALVRDTAARLEASDKKKVLRAVERLVAADAPKAAGVRDRSPRAGHDTAAIYREVLSAQA